jgi:hypothetical protein
MGKVIIALSCRFGWVVVLLLDSPGTGSSSVLILFTIYGFDACIPFHFNQIPTEQEMMMMN